MTRLRAGTLGLVCALAIGAKAEKPNMYYAKPSTNCS